MDKKSDKRGKEEAKRRERGRQQFEKKKIEIDRKR